jgi:hypothetical protein
MNNVETIATTGATVETAVLNVSENSNHDTPTLVAFVQSPPVEDSRSLLEKLPPTTRLVDISPRLAVQSGLIPSQFVPSSCASAIFSNAPTWEQLAQTSIGRLKDWHGVGLGRASQVVAFALSVSTNAEQFDANPVSSEVAVSPIDAVKSANPLGLKNQELLPANISRSIALVSGWAIAKGLERGLLEALMSAESSDVPPSVKMAMDFLRALDLRDLVSKDDLISFDPIQAAIELLSEFDAQDRLLLERLLARGIRPVLTLEEIGQKLNLTRERVRQIEVRVGTRLTHKLEIEKYAAVTRHANALTLQLGAAFPVDELPSELTPETEGSLVDELFAHLAGPFVQSEGWFVRRAVAPSIEALLDSAFVSSVNGYAAPLDALKDALSAVGVRDDMTDKVLATGARYQIIGDTVVRWSGIRERVVGLLHATGRPMTFDEIQVAVIDGQSVNSVRNFLADSPLVKRTKKNEWALASWEGAEYRNILEHMRDELVGLKLPVSELVSRLGEKFDISSTSVTMYASMHPLFVQTEGIVRLRREDEPYIPTASLEMTADCYQIDGAWSHALTVDKDLMRGSGRVMPEAFAVHLGLQPGGNGSLQSADRTIMVGWNMNPFFGSLRWVVERDGLTLGDRLFVIRSKPSELEFRSVRANEINETVPPIDKLQCIVGARGSLKVLERWLGDSLGLGGASTPTLIQLRARLLARSESELAIMLDKSKNLSANSE